MRSKIAVWNPEQLTIGDRVVHRQFPKEDREARKKWTGTIVAIKPETAVAFAVATVEWSDGNKTDFQLDPMPMIRRVDLVTQIGDLDGG